MFQGIDLSKHWIGLVAMTVAACAELPPPPAIVNVTVNGAADLNPNAGGRPSPTVVRVYYLVSDTTFKDADFFQLFEQEAATLGADLVASDELMISPGASLAVSRELRDDVRFFGPCRLLPRHRNRRLARRSRRATEPDHRGSGAVGGEFGCPFGEPGRMTRSRAVSTGPAHRAYRRV